MTDIPRGIAERLCTNNMTVTRHNGRASTTANEPEPTLMLPDKLCSSSLTLSLCKQYLGVCVSTVHANKDGDYNQHSTTYRNSKRMAVNGMVKRLCKEEEVGYVDLWDSFVGKEDMYVRDGLHLSGKGAAVFAEGLSGAVVSGLGKVRYLN